MGSNAYLHHGKGVSTGTDNERSRCLSIVLKALDKYKDNFAVVGALAEVSLSIQGIKQQTDKIGSGK